MGVFLWPERPGELCLAGGFKVKVFKVKGHVVLPGRPPFKGQVKGDFVLPEGSPGRARSKAISYRLKPARAGPAVAPALHPRYPANTTARCAGTLSKSVFLTDQARFAPGSTHLLAASLRLVLENTFPSAAVMPLKVKTQDKVKGDFVLPEGRPPFKGQVKGHFVLPEGSPSRAGSRPGPAPALSGKHNRPRRGYPQQKRFPDGPGAIRSKLNAPSRRIPAARPGKHFSLGVCDASSRSKPRSKSKR